MATRITFLLVCYACASSTGQVVEDELPVAENSLNWGPILLHIQHKNAGVTVETTARTIMKDHLVSFDGWQEACKTPTSQHDCNADDRCRFCVIAWAEDKGTDMMWENYRSPFIYQQQSSFQPQIAAAENFNRSTEAPETEDNNNPPATNDGAVAIQEMPQFRINPQTTQVISVYRHPIHRLISSTFYCLASPKNARDPLCGDKVHSFKNYVDFARFQRNIAFRELLGHPLINSKTQLGTNSKTGDKTRMPGKRGGLPYEYWQEWMYVLGEAGDPKSKPLGVANFELVLTAIENDYFSFGFAIMEKWDDMMELFECIAPLWKPPSSMLQSYSPKNDNGGSARIPAYTRPHVYIPSWANESAKHKETHMSGAYKQQELVVLQEAKNNKQVLDWLEGDLTIYHILLEKFENRIEMIRAGKFPCAF